jgi:hypothetical protein
MDNRMGGNTLEVILIDIVHHLFFSLTIRYRVENSKYKYMLYSKSMGKYDKQA